MDPFGKLISVLLLVLCLVNVSRCARWAHSVYLSPDYRLLWVLGPGPQDITFELQVRTLGYVGFGFSKDGRMAGSDMVIGWVDHKQVYFQVRIAFGFINICIQHVLSNTEMVMKIINTQNCYLLGVICKGYFLMSPY